MTTVIKHSRMRGNWNKKSERVGTGWRLPPPNNLPDAERKKLVASVYGLAAGMAKRYARKYIDQNDLVQAAMLGACKASKYWQPDRGACFCTVATLWIRGELQTTLRAELKHCLASGDAPVMDEDTCLFSVAVPPVPPEQWSELDWKFILAKLDKKRAEVVRSNIRDGKNFVNIAADLGKTPARVRQLFVDAIPQIQAVVERMTA